MYRGEFKFKPQMTPICGTGEGEGNRDHERGSVR